MVYQWQFIIYTSERSAPRPSTGQPFLAVSLHASALLMLRAVIRSRQAIFSCPGLWQTCSTVRIYRRPTCIPLDTIASQPKDAPDTTGLEKKRGRPGVRHQNDHVPVVAICPPRMHAVYDER